MKDLERLCRHIGHQFEDSRLLITAMTHRSVSINNNERLEFLGDAVLSFVIAEALYQRYPRAKEGELSRLRAALVNGETLATLANEFELGNYLQLGVGELKSGGAQRESILADALEALIGAIFLDAGFEHCRDCVLNWFQSRLHEVSPLKTMKDPKTQLQELLQSRHLPLPQYDIQRITGEAHEQFFYVECRVEGVRIVTRGEGKSRRKAEQEAATKFLQSLGEQ